MSNTFIIYGTGRMGRSVAIHLAKHETGHIRLVDMNKKSLDNLEKELISFGTKTTIDTVLIPVPVLGTHPLKLHNRQPYDVVVCIATAGYQIYPELTKQCIDNGIHMIDLGGNRDVVLKQKLLDHDAKHEGVTHIPDCGLAPGMINILGMHTFNILNEKGCTDIDVNMKVGGLPFNPGTMDENPWQYTLTWSADGLINEYDIEADELRDGKHIKLRPLSECEDFKLRTPWSGKNKFEAFITGGGSSNLPELLCGKARNVSYKTIRYRGHNNITKTLRKLGLFDNSYSDFMSNRTLLRSLLEHNFKSQTSDDIVIATVTASGTDQNTQQRLSTTISVFCRYDQKLNLSAMAQTTGFSAAILAQMIMDSSISSEGVLDGETAVPAEEFILRLRLAGIKVTISSTF